MICFASYPIWIMLLQIMHLIPKQSIPILFSILHWLWSYDGTGCWVRSYIKFLMINDMLCTKVNTRSQWQHSAEIRNISKVKKICITHPIILLNVADGQKYVLQSSNKSISWFYVLINQDLGKMCNFFMHISHTVMMFTLIKTHLSYPVSN